MTHISVGLLIFYSIFECTFGKAGTIQKNNFADQDVAFSTEGKQVYSSL